MSTSPVTLMVARRVAKGRYEELMAWLREGEQLATDFPGYLGSGVLAPPPNDDEFQIIFRFADEQTLHGLGSALGRIEQAFALRVFAQAFEDFAVVVGQGHTTSSQTAYLICRPPLTVRVVPVT